jgi:glycosyltransferase involved in cell wall biosynthesis
MRIVIDLQGAQCESRHRGIGRYSLALAQAMVRNRGSHEIIIALSGLFPTTIEPIRAAFDGLLPKENIRVWFAHGPVHAFDPENNWRRRTAEFLREAFLASLQPDIVHVTSLMEGFGDNAVHSIGRSPVPVPTAVTFYDLIPLIQSDVYLTPNPTFEALYREKLDHLRRADLYLAISESSRSEAISHLNVGNEQAVNICAAADNNFKRVHISEEDRAALRKRFGLSRPYLMYSGATDERKNHLRLIKAFSLLPSEFRKGYQLAIVGRLPGHHREKFEAYVKVCGLGINDVVITGGVSDADMVRLYNMCELFVFPSWHEGFGLPALEAMSCGAPVIGANTTSIPEVIGRSDALFDPFDENAIAQKIIEVLKNDSLRADLKNYGLEQATKFTWDRSAKTAIAAFERWYAQQPPIRTSLKREQPSDAFAQWLIGRIAEIKNPPTDEHDWLKTAQAIAQNHADSTQNQLLVDITELVRHDAKTGVQRVVRSVLAELLACPPKGFKVEPVYTNHDNVSYRYAREFTRNFSIAHAGDVALADEPVEIASGDVFLGLDLNHIISRQVEFYEYLKRIGVQLYFVVYDFGPIFLPDFFPDNIPNLHSQWLNSVANADGAVCISRAVADEMSQWLDVFGPKRLRPFKLGWFHLGADLAGSVPTKGLPPNASHDLHAISSRPTFLMVGTIEPRKGHMQTLAAFELLWNQGLDVNLVIIGKHGWNVTLLVELLSNHSERNGRLFWLEGISDEYLEKVYDASTCLIAASEAEGFGLPLIEASQHGLPIIARDLPVFREVASEHAFYFSGLSPNALSEAVLEWLVLNDKRRAPQSQNIPSLSWKKSTESLLSVVLGGQWYKQWMPDRVRRFWGRDSRLRTQVGKHMGLNIVSTGQAGNLIHGPYLDLDAGGYQVVVRGTSGKNGLAGASVDVALDKGELILAQSDLVEPDKYGRLATLSISLDAPCTNLEVRVWVNHVTEVQVSMIEVAPLQNEQEGSYLNMTGVMAKSISHRNACVAAPLNYQGTAQTSIFAVRNDDKTDFVVANVRTEMIQEEFDIGSNLDELVDLIPIEEFSVPIGAGGMGPTKVLAGIEPPPHNVPASAATSESIMERQSASSPGSRNRARAMPKKQR